MKNLIAIIFVLISVGLQAQDSLLTLPQRQQQSERLSEHFSFVSEEHLSSTIFRQSYSLTHIVLNGNYHAESEAVSLQAGKDKWEGAFQATSYQLLKSAVRLWGEAQYKNGLKQEVLWNESSDLELLYPYQTADSIGGDIRSETYFFKGGYSQEYKKIVWAAEAQYRALLEHRKVDPRPKNTVADFQLKVGVGWNFVSDYVMMLSGTAQRYKQTGDIQYYSAQGNARTVHLTGLGMEYIRFSGTNNKVSYKGSGGGAVLSILPKNKLGYHFSADYNYFAFEKMLVDLNSLPMVKLKTHDVKLFFAWMDGSSVAKWGVKALGEIIVQNGTENIFGDPANNVYPQIASTDMYQCKEYSAEISGFYEWESNKRLIVSAQPKVTYTDRTEQYLYPNREIAAKHITPAFDLNFSIPLKKVLLSATAYAGYAVNIDKQTLLTELTPDDRTYDLVMNIADYRQSDQLTTKVAICCDISAGKKLLFFLKAGWQYRHYKTRNIHAHEAQLTVGVGI